MVTQTNAVPSGGAKNKISKLPLKPKTSSLNPPLVKRTTRAGQKEVSQSKEMVVNPLSTRISLTPDEQEEVPGTPENSEDETLDYGDAENELSFDQNPYAHIPPIPSTSQKAKHGENYLTTTIERTEGCDNPAVDEFLVKSRDAFQDIVNSSGQIYDAIKVLSKGNIRSETRVDVMQRAMDIIQSVTTIQSLQMSAMQEMIRMFSSQKATQDKQNIKPSESTIKSKHAPTYTKKTTYSEVVKRTSHSLTITPKDPSETAENLTKAVKQKVNPKELGAAFSGFEKRGNKLKLSFPTKEDKTKVFNQLKGDSQFSIKESRKPSPTVILKGVRRDFPLEELIPTIIKQNDILKKVLNVTDDESTYANIEGNNNANEEIKIIKTQKNRKTDMLTNVIMMVNEKVFKQMTSQERIAIGYQYVRVLPYISIKRCYNCLGYGHIAANCEQEKLQAGEILCFYCGSNHKAENCLSKDKPDLHTCLNCTRTRRGQESFGTEINQRHHTMSNSCPVYRRIFENERAYQKYLQQNDRY